MTTLPLDGRDNKQRRQNFPDPDFTILCDPLLGVARYTTKWITSGCDVIAFTTVIRTIAKRANTSIAQGQTPPLPRTPAKPHRSTATATFCLHSTANQLRFLSLPPPPPAPIAPAAPSLALVSTVISGAAWYAFRFSFHFADSGNAGTPRRRTWLGVPGRSGRASCRFPPGPRATTPYLHRQRLGGPR